jgi:hypothetical protein
VKKVYALLALVAVGVVLGGCTQRPDAGPAPSLTPSGSGSVLAHTTPTDAGPAPSLTPSGSGGVVALTTPTTTSALATITCDLASVELVSSALEQPVWDLSATTRDGRVWCSYRFSANGGVAVVMSHDVSPDQFDQWRNLIAGATNMEFTDLPGFEDRAFVGTNPHAPIYENSVAGLRGTTAVLVTGSHMSVDAEKRLVSTMLDKLTGSS